MGFAFAGPLQKRRSSRTELLVQRSFGPRHPRPELFCGPGGAGRVVERATDTRFCNHRMIQFQVTRPRLVPHALNLSKSGVLSVDK